MHGIMRTGEVNLHPMRQAFLPNSPWGRALDLVQQSLPLGRPTVPRSRTGRFSHDGRGTSKLLVSGSVVTKQATRVSESSIGS